MQPVFTRHHVRVVQCTSSTPSCRWHLSSRAVLCHAGKGQAYYEKYKANRVRHTGVLLPPPEPGDCLLPDLPLADLEAYLQRELWAYTFGDPCPHDLRPQTSQNSTADNAAKAEVAQEARAPGAKGVIIPPPDVTPVGVSLVVPLPLPVRYNTNLAQVHVFWDVASKHPEARDPRVVASRLRALAAAYGNVAGCYAYAVRKDWNWVPEYFLQYRADGGRGMEAQDGKLRCPVCGVSRRTEGELLAHIQSVHPQASAAGVTGVMGTETTPGPLPERRGSVTGAAGSGSVAMVGGGGAQLGGFVAVRPAGTAGVRTRNTSRRTVGKVSQYHTAQGRVVVPPAGHQLSLKYCLEQEGWEARVVQNAAEAESVAIGAGMGRFLDRIRQGKVGGGPGEKVVVLLVSDDEERLQQPLIRLRGVGGCATVVVRQSVGGSQEQRLTQDSSRANNPVRQAGQRRGSRAQEGGQELTFRGADLVLSWTDVVTGMYWGPQP